MNMNPTTAGLDDDDEVPVTVLLSAEQHAELEALIARLRLEGIAGEDADLVDHIFRAGMADIANALKHLHTCTHERS